MFASVTFQERVPFIPVKVTLIKGDFHSRVASPVCDQLAPGRRACSYFYQIHPHGNTLTPIRKRMCLRKSFVAPPETKAAHGRSIQEYHQPLAEPKASSLASRSVSLATLLGVNVEYLESRFGGNSFFLTTSRTVVYFDTVRSQCYCLFSPFTSFSKPTHGFDWYLTVIMVIVSDGRPLSAFLTTP